MWVKQRSVLEEMRPRGWVTKTKVGVLMLVWVQLQILCNVLWGWTVTYWNTRLFYLECFLFSDHWKTEGNSLCLSGEFSWALLTTTVHQNSASTCAFDFVQLPKFSLLISENKKLFQLLFPHSRVLCLADRILSPHPEVTNVPRPKPTCDHHLTSSESLFSMIAVYLASIALTVLGCL